MENISFPTPDSNTEGQMPSLTPEIHANPSKPKLIWLAGLGGVLLIVALTIVVFVVARGQLSQKKQLVNVDNAQRQLPLSEPLSTVAVQSGVELPQGFKIEENLQLFGLEVGYPENWKAQWYKGTDNVYGSALFVPFAETFSEKIDTTMLSEFIGVSVAHVLNMKNEVEAEWSLEFFSEEITKQQSKPIIFERQEITVAGNRAFQIAYRDPADDRLHNTVKFLVADAYGGGIFIAIEYVAREPQYSPATLEAVLATINDRVAETQKNSQRFKEQQQRSMTTEQKEQEFLAAFVQKYGANPMPKFLPDGVEFGETTPNSSNDIVGDHYSCPKLKNYKFVKNPLVIEKQSAKDRYATVESFLDYQGRSNQETYTAVSINGNNGYLIHSTLGGYPTERELIWVSGKLFISIDVPGNCNDFITDDNLLQMARSMK